MRPDQRLFSERSAVFVRPPPGAPSASILKYFQLFREEASALFSFRQTRCLASPGNQSYGVAVVTRIRPRQGLKMEEKLVLSVSVYPELYDMSDKHYHNRDRKAQLWEQVGRMLNISGE